MESISACGICGLIQRMGELRADESAACARCGTVLRRNRKDSLERTAALSLAALILYVPANIYPILRMEYYGLYSESTVWDGCVKLFQDGQWPVAIIVFLASILIPLFKLLGLFFLVSSAKSGSPRRRRERTIVYRVIEAIGPWAMLDVFLLAVLVALVKLERIATILPGRGLLAFAAVVVFTILASAFYDPRTIWDGTDEP
jgi:paraquat-inducible protein A